MFGRRCLEVAISLNLQGFLIIRVSTNVVQVMVLCCNLWIIRDFVDLSRKFEVFWWGNLGSGFCGWRGWNGLFFKGFGDLRNERTTVRVEVKNSFIVKVFIFRYIYLQELISTVTSENFYYIWKNLQNLSLTDQNIYANIRIITKEISEIHSITAEDNIRNLGWKTEYCYYYAFLSVFYWILKEGYIMVKNVPIGDGHRKGMAKRRLQTFNSKVKSG